MRANQIHLLERSQRLALPIEEAYRFFSVAENLELLTPSWLSFRLVTPEPIVMGPGTMLEYRLKLHRVPIRWQARIEVWEPPRRFVDIQLRGPYALWEHTHTFEPTESDEVVIRDRVRYALPFGPLGRLAHSVFVRRDLERIFEYRQQAAERWLKAGASSKP